MKKKTAVKVAHLRGQLQGIRAAMACGEWAPQPEETEQLAAELGIPLLALSVCNLPVNSGIEDLREWEAWKLRWAVFNDDEGWR